MMSTTYRLGVRLILALLCSMGALQGAAAKNIFVCPTCAFTSIQPAVNSAVSGDTVFVAAGLYVENILIEGKDLKLIGAGGGNLGSTQVAAAQRGPVFTLGSGVSTDPYHLIEIHSLTISGGNHQTTTGVGGGVQVRAGAYLHIFDSTILQNIAAFGGGIGINTPGGPQTTITRCLITQNLTQTSPGDMFFNTGGGGIAVLTGSSATVQNSTISRNQTTAQFGGAGIYALDQTNLTVTDSTVSENSAAENSGGSGGNGGGLFLFGDFVISGSTITHNVGSGPAGFGGGLFIGISDSGAHSIKNTSITQNSITRSDGGGGIDVAAIGAGGNMTLDHVYVVENLASGGLVVSGGGVTLQLIDSTFKDNVGGDCVGAGCPH